MVVVLDDVAGSGDSLVSAVARMNSAVGGGDPYLGNVLVSPMVSTEMARDRFGDGWNEGESAAAAAVKFQPRAMARALAESSFFQGLPEPKKMELESNVEAMGYRGNATSMAFPYMAPDNNNRFFAESMAPFFIANRNRAASKVV